MGTTLKKSYSGRNREKIEVRECLLVFGAESFIFQFVINNLKIKISRTIILPVVLYGRETWSLTLRKKRSVKVFKIGVLRRIFEPKRNEVTGEWRNYVMRSSPYIIRVIKSMRMRWAAHATRMWDRRCAYRIVVKKPEEKRALERPRPKWG